MPEGEGHNGKGASALEKAKMFLGKRDNLILLALVAIIGYALVYQLVFVEGPSYFGDDTVYTFYAWKALHGTFAENSDVFTLRLLNIYPISFFYLLFGVGRLSSAGWAITTLIGSIVVAFLLGKELYNDYAGLIAALLLSFVPLMTVLSGTPTPNVPEEFFIGIAVLSLIYGQRRDSWRWYFASGASLVAAFLATPESAYAFPFIFVYIAAELIRKRIRISRTTLSFVAGLALAGALLMLFNYASTGNPLMTLSGTAAVYSTVGTTKAGVIVNNDLSYYFTVMFPYDMQGALWRALAAYNLDPVAIWNAIYVMNYNYFGFFFYALVLCAAYVLVTKERRAYVPMLWLALGFLMLEFGPIYISLSPFRYVLTHRLERYLTLIMIPLVLIVSIAIVNMAERLREAKHRYAALAPLLLVIFLIATSLPVSQFWYTIVKVQTSDMYAIANYLNALPNTTRIAYESGFTIMQVYMRYSNESRFLVYDNIPNCTSIPAGYYVLIPKYVQAFSLNYTPDPSKYCPGWRLVLYPQMNASYPSYVTGAAMSSGAKLYYVPK